MLSLTRLHTAGWEGFVFLLGPLLVRADVVSWNGLVLWGLGVLINAFIFVLNNLADLASDRLNPTRRASPLVSGALDPSVALVWSCALPSIMWLVIVAAGWPRDAQAAFAGLLLLGTYLCVYQKTSRRLHPVLLDTLFGLSMAGPIAVAVLALDREVPGSVWCVAGAFMALSVSLNSVGGNLKDLAADRSAGFRTVAIALGATLKAGGQIEASPAYRRFSLSMPLLVAGGLAAAVLLGDSSMWVTVFAVVGVVACGMAMLVALRPLLDGRRVPSARGREPHFAFGMLGVLIVAASSAHPVDLVIVVGVTLAWEVAFRAFLAITDARWDRRG